MVYSCPFPYITYTWVGKKTCLINVLISAMVYIASNHRVYTHITPQEERNFTHETRKKKKNMTRMTVCKFNCLRFRLGLLLPLCGTGAGPVLNGTCVERTFPHIPGQTLKLGRLKELRAFNTPLRSIAPSEEEALPGVRSSVSPLTSRSLTG